MKRDTFNTLAGLAWICVAAWAGIYCERIYNFSQDLIPELGTAAFPMVALAAIVVGLFVQSVLADRISPRQVGLPSDLSPTEKRERAVREAGLALKQDRKGTALLIYEEAGMYLQALEQARELGDKPSLARLHFRLGQFGRARRLYADLRDHEMAGNMSLMLNEVPAAREYYRLAVESCKNKVPEVQEAGLLDRAGDRAAAAILYEKAAELDRAAECYELIGDRRNATRCADQAKVMRAVQDKMRNLPREAKEREAAQQKLRAARQAKELEAQGDFLGAGLLHRDAGMYMEAALAFERCEEWERAANAYDQAGLKNRAEMARMRVEAKKEVFEDEAAPAEPGRLSAPPPGAAQPKAFVPISRAQAIPVYLGTGGSPPVTPMARLEVCRRVRRGNFLEAAEFAKAAGDWVMAAAYYEHGGKYVAAADIYRQIGDINAAAWCLEKAGRPREAAYVTLAVGQRERAVELFLKALDQDEDGQEAAVTLGELLVQWKKHALALEFFRKALAPLGLNQRNAEVGYRFARWFEDQRAPREAHTLYRELIIAGVSNEDVVAREARLEAALGQSDGEPAGAKSDSKPGETEDEIAKMVRAALPRLAASAERRARALPDNAEKPSSFLLTPKSQPLPGAAGSGAAGARPITLPAQRISLFGRSVGESGPIGVVDDEPGLAPGAAGEGRERTDPFRPRQRYEIKREIGRGGMGVVYETVDTILNRRVALKLILQESANSRAYGQFLVEARAIALLSHPNVVIIYDVGLMGLQHYIAMEYVDGGNLADLIAKEGGLPLKESLRIFIEMSRALRAAHETGIVHRDVKPQNVLLSTKGPVKITDFGLAKIRSADSADRKAFEFSGTPGYMAPEQILGEESHPRFDVYALGVTLFAMLVGKAPYEIANKSLLQDILEFQKAGVRIPLRRYRPNVPEPVERIYEYCTAVNKDDRYQSIDAFLPTVEQIHAAL